ncbi:hypothetical protein [Vibrio alfacsensis]|uniref:hypothetical protein n=1 Tax=Vibrio alfacsensis TaxID=1074311 RepID=UPI004068338E
MVTQSKGLQLKLTIPLALSVLSFHSALYAEDIQQPIYPTPANSGNYCMADAYVNSGGSGLKGSLGESLNCTANDVEITDVTPTAIVLPDGTVSNDLTCTEGETFTLVADVLVRANAAERWDTTFYIPRKAETTTGELISPDVINKIDDACSILLPVPQGTSGFDPGFLKAQQLDGDACGDIVKRALTNDQYTLEDAQFEISCVDENSDGQLDFNYCAAWDNIERNNCNADVGQVPNNKSKCNCDNFDIPVFIVPDAPSITKTLLSGSSATEPSGMFSYRLTITKEIPGPNVNITALEDIYYSTTDNSISLVFDLDAQSSDQTMGPVTYLVENNTCKDVVLPFTLTDSAPTLTCTFSVQVNDDNLPDDTIPNSATSPSEDYFDFVRFSATDSEGRGVILGNDQCDPRLAPLETGDNCSNTVAVSMLNIDPNVSITKTPISGPGLRQVPADGPYFVDNQGDITYEVTVTNLSTVDNVDTMSFYDDNGTDGTSDDIDLLADTTGSPQCQVEAQKTLSTNSDSFTCQYVVNVAIEDTQTYTNKVHLTVRDNENRVASNMAMASVTRAVPDIILQKDVAVSIDPTIDSPSIDSASFMDMVTVDEPGDQVVYRFTVTNNNTLTQEALTVTGLVDDVLFASARATMSADQRSDKCNFNSTVVNYGTPYVCTIVADVTGQTPAELTLINTAYVTATAPNGKNIQSNEDMATVNFNNVTPQIQTDFGLSALVFVRVKNISSFEDVTLKSFSIKGVALPDINTSTTNGILRIVNDGVTRTAFEGLISDSSFEYCALNTLIPAGEEYQCHVKLEFSADLSLINFLANDSNSGGIEIGVQDDDGTDAMAEQFVEIVTTNP